MSHIYRDFSNKNNRGFTLVELMVVIGIISLLASIVLATLQKARLKGKDSFIKEQMVQLRNIIELDYNETGSYANFQGVSGIYGWAPLNVPCSTFSSKGNYGPKAVEICNSIMS